MMIPEQGYARIKLNEQGPSGTTPHNIASKLRLHGDDIITSALLVSYSFKFFY